MRSASESFADVFIILFVVIVNAVLGVYQESKDDAAIEALQKMAAATSKVLRDGTAAAHICLSELARLPAYVVFIENPSEICNRFGGGVGGVGLASCAGIFCHNAAVMELSAVCRLNDVGEIGVKTNGNVCREAF